MDTNAFEALDSAVIAAALRAPVRFSLALLDNCASTSTLLLDRA